MNDSTLTTYYSHSDQDLTICPYNGVAYQHTLDDLVEYGDDYFARYEEYEGSEIADRLNAFRRWFSGSLGPGKAVLDVGVGSLEFLRSIEWRKRYGADVNPKALQTLQELGWLVDLDNEPIPVDVGCATLWDVFEHLPEPSAFLAKIPSGVVVCVSLPIFDDLSRIRESKHYKPGEHLTYWTSQGIRSFFARHGFVEEATSWEETKCGRESIGSFRWRKP